jgi:hypothetical protein
MVDLPLPQIHEVGAKNDKRYSDDEKGKTQTMQQWM